MTRSKERDVGLSVKRGEPFTGLPCGNCTNTQWVLITLSVKGVTGPNQMVECTHCKRRTQAGEVHEHKRSA